MGTLNMKDLLGIQRALGFIEGICAGLKDKEAELIEEAITEIDCVLENTSSVASDTVPPFQEGKALMACYTTGEMDELVERLVKHHNDYIYGKPYNAGQAFHDMRMAADVITLLRQQLEDLEDKGYGSYMERP